MIDIDIVIEKKNGLETRYRRSIPTAWGEITSGERRLFYYKKTLLEERAKAETVILKDLLNLPKSVFFAQNSADLKQLSEEIGFMFCKTSKLDIASEFEHRGVTYYFIKDDFDNGTAYEFAYADENYVQWCEEPTNTDAVMNVLACICRTNPDTPNTNKYELEACAKQFARVRSLGKPRQGAPVVQSQESVGELGKHARRH